MILNSVSVDCVIFGFDKSGFRVLLNQIDKDALKQSLPEKISSDQISVEQVGICQISSA